MKRKILFLFCLLSSSVAFAQRENVGIGTIKPDASAVLDVNSSTKGLLMPRMSLQQRNSIQNPAKGLIIYQTDMISGFYYFDGSEWKGISNSEKSVAGTDGDWTNVGNSGLNSATNFLGTTDAVDLVFKVNNQKSGLIQVAAPNQTFFGYQSGKTSTGDDNIGIGNYSLTSNTTGARNTAVGMHGLRTNTTGNDNMAFGRASLYNNTTGSNNTAIASAALFSNTTGVDNLALGTNALYVNTTGNYNIGIGASALFQVNGNLNVGIGFSAGSLKNGNGNVYIGPYAGKSTIGLTGENNKLYIANTEGEVPLIYGDFSAKFVAIGDISATSAKRDGLASNYGLLVQKGILTEKIKVATLTSADWADYVFEKNYKVMTLDEVEAFIKENKHLPNVPTTEEMMKNGNDLLKTDAKLLEKIEELTLYMIEMNKEIKSLKLENEQLKKEIKK